MSRIPDLGENMQRLPDLLSEYEAELDKAADILNIKGKPIGTANSENPSWFSYYDQKKSELAILVKYMEAKVAETRSKLFRNLTEFNQRELSDNAKNKYIDSEEAYLDKYELYLEVKEMYDKFEVISKAFQARGYALNNITKTLVAEVNDFIVQ